MAARTPPAHKPLASMSWCARRLRHEPFDERSATPHIFEIGEKCEKTPSNASSANAKGVMLPSSKTSKHSELPNSLSKCAVFRTTALFFNFCVWSQVMVLR